MAREVAEKGKDSIPLVAELQATCPVELIDEAVAVFIVSALAGLCKSSKKISDFVCTDFEFAAEVIVVLKPLTYSGQDLPLNLGCAPD